MILMTVFMAVLGAGSGEAALDTAGSFSPDLASMAAVPPDMVLSNLDRYEESLAQVEAWAGPRPWDVKWINALGYVHYVHGRFREAVEVYKEAVSRDPSRADYQNNLGCALSQAGLPNQALEVLEKAQRDSPADPTLAYNIGVLHFERHETAKAAQYWRIALSGNPGDGETLNNLGAALVQEGQVQEARDLFGEASKKGGEPEFFHNLALTEMTLNRTREARKALGRALEIRPRYAEAKALLALAADLEQNPEEAVVLYEEALEVRPEFPEAHTNLGRVLIRLGRIEEGLRHLKAAVVFAPEGDYRYLLNLADAHQGAGNHAAAARYFEHILKNFPDVRRPAAIYNNLGLAYAVTNREQEAEAAWSQALSLDPNLPTAGRNRAEALYQKGQFGDALEAFRKLANAETPEIQSREASCLFRMGRDEEAFSVYKKLEKSLPFESHLGQGLIHQRRENPKAALEPLRKALSLSPADQRVRILGLLALAHAGLSQDEEAKRLGEEALALDPDNPEAHLALSSVALRSKDLAAAEAHLKAGSAAGSGETDQAQSRLGLEHYRQGQFERAAEIYEKALEANPVSAEAHAGLGAVYIRLAQLEKAESHLQESLKHRPGHAETLYNLGILAERKGDMPQAETAYSQAVSVRGDYAEALVALALLRGQNPGDGTAESLLRAALKADPEFVPARYNLGGLLYRQGRYYDSAAAFQEVLVADPENAEARFSLALAYEELGRNADAAVEFSKAAKLRPADSRLLKRLGASLVKARDFSAAVMSLEKAERLSPEDPEIWLYYGVGLSMSGDEEKGLRYLEKAAQAPDQAIAAKAAQYLKGAKPK